MKTMIDIYRSDFKGFEDKRWYEVSEEQIDKIIKYCKGNEA